MRIHFFKSLFLYGLSASFVAGIAESQSVEQLTEEDENRSESSFFLPLYKGSFNDKNWEELTHVQRGVGYLFYVIDSFFIWIDESLRSALGYPYEPKKFSWFTEWAIESGHYVFVFTTCIVLCIVAFSLGWFTGESEKIDGVEE